MPNAFACDLPRAFVAPCRMWIRPTEAVYVDWRPTNVPRHCDRHVHSHPLSAIGLRLRGRGNGHPPEFRISSNLSVAERFVISSTQPHEDSGQHLPFLPRSAPPARPPPSPAARASFVPCFSSPEPLSLLPSPPPPPLGLAAVYFPVVSAAHFGHRRHQRCSS